MGQSPQDIKPGDQSPESKRPPETKGSPENLQWQARQPYAVERAARYSRFVRTMRITLPLIAFALMTAVIIFSVSNKPKVQIATSYKSQEETAGYISMKAPRFNGLDVDGRYYVVTADEAMRPAGKINKVELTEVLATISQNGEPRLTLNAQKGTVDAHANQLTFGPAVAVDLQDGFRLQTDHAFADLAKGTIRGNEPLSGTSPFGTFSADRFEVVRSKQVVRLVGHVRMTINPAALENAPQNLHDLEDRQSADPNGTKSEAP